MGAPQAALVIEPRIQNPLPSGHSQQVVSAPPLSQGEPQGSEHSREPDRPSDGALNWIKTGHLAYAQTGHLADAKLYRLCYTVTRLHSPRPRSGGE
jgi:hypothetical protein